MFNILQHCEPHQGYQELHKIIGMASEAAKVKDNWHIYHQGIDDFYQKSLFHRNKICQPKGSLFRWQCSGCKSIVEKKDLFAMMGFQLPIFEIDYIAGGVQKTPQCRKCRIPYRPNV